MDVKKIVSEYLQDESKITNEHYQVAIDFINKECKAKGICAEEYVNDKGNIEEVAKKIHSQLSWLVKKVVSVNVLKEVLDENHSFILRKFDELMKPTETVKPKKQK